MRPNNIRSSIRTWPNYFVSSEQDRICQSQIGMRPNHKIGMRPNLNARKETATLWIVAAQEILTLVQAGTWENKLQTDVVHSKVRINCTLFYLGFMLVMLAQFPLTLLRTTSVSYLPGAIFLTFCATILKTHFTKLFYYSIGGKLIYWFATIKYLPSLSWRKGIFLTFYTTISKSLNLAHRWKSYSIFLIFLLEGIKR
jgi:hypothetical protein